MTLGIKLISSYFQLKATAEHFIGHPWKDEELLKIVNEEIVKLKIGELLKEAVETGFITCQGCGKEKLRPKTMSCSKCRWENPLVSLNILGQQIPLF